ncbi:zinc-binding protein A33-like [Rhinoraja longicauda]
MASKREFESLREDLLCPICLDLFTDPVSPECGHNFCRSCITQSWEHEDRNPCPECSEEFADRTLRASRALARLCEKARALSLSPQEKRSTLRCEEHQEELRLFCDTDKTLICLVCAAGREHKSHSFMPVDEAVEIYKAEIKSSLESLAQNTLALERMEKQQKQKIHGVREQSQFLQSHISSLFAELHQILIDKEQRLLKYLNDEKGVILNTMEKSLHEIQVRLNLMQQDLPILQKQLDQVNVVTLLQEEAGRKRRGGYGERTLLVAEGELPVEKFDHPFLLNVPLGKMFGIIKRDSVTLDVETVSSKLEVSEDRKSVRWTGSQRSLPDSGKRFTHWPCVLGSEGFASGRHYWEVEVVGNWGWYLGVAAESLDKGSVVNLRKMTGLWSMEQVGDEFRANSSPEGRLLADPIPERLGVYLSYEAGIVSFYSADTKSHLHTFRGNKFTGKLYPFFGTWDGNECLRICSRPALDL